MVYWRQKVKTLLVAILAALVLGLTWEGTIKARGVLASCAFVRLGRIRAMAWCYRPGRLYVRVGVTCGA